MGRKKEKDASFRFSVRISAGLSPRVYMRLKNEDERGEGRAQVLRRLAEEYLFLNELRQSHGLQLVESQQVFEKNFINQPPMVMKINDEVKTETRNTSLTKNQVNEVFVQPKAALPTDSDPSKNFINRPPVVMKKKSGAREMARLMVARGLI
jgi:nitrate reductase cytochrome c-type subunit